MSALRGPPAGYLPGVGPGSSWSLRPDSGEKQEGEISFLGSMGHMEELLWLGEVPSSLPRALLGAGGPLPACMCSQEGAGWPVMGGLWGGLTHVASIGVGRPREPRLWVGLLQSRPRCFWAGRWKREGLQVWPLPIPHVRCVLGTFQSQPMPELNGEVKSGVRYTPVPEVCALGLSLGGAVSLRRVDIKNQLPGEAEGLLPGGHGGKGSWVHLCLMPLLSPTGPPRL